METPLPENLSAAIQELVRGQESAKMLRLLLSKSNQQLKDVGEAADLGSAQPVSALVGDVLRSFTNTLSMLNSGDSGEVSQVPAAKSLSVKSEESEESSKSNAPRDRRGCYKRRKASDSLTKLTSILTDDGHQWRKYGQKAIQNTNFPRNYFRCTHKVEHGCQATKQVQMMSDDPPLYRTIYLGNHTCSQNLLKAAPQIILDDSPPSRRGSSSIILSFKTSNNGVDPFSSSCSSQLPNSTIIKMETKDHQKTTPINGQQQVTVLNKDYQSTSISSNYYLPVLTTELFDSTLGSDQGAEVWSSSSYYSFDDGDHLIDLEDAFSF